MSSYRIAAARDEFCGKFYAILFHPADSNDPIGYTKPLFDSEAEALARVDESLRAMFCKNRPKVRILFPAFWPPLKA